MYVDITSVIYNEAENLCLIEAVDLDNVLLSSWSQPYEKSEVTFKFDLIAKGPRIYLFKLIRSQIKEFGTLEEGLLALTGRITNISGNFIDKAEG